MAGLLPALVKYRLPRPHSAEQAIICRPPAKINVLASGSKFGKTVGACRFFVHRGMTRGGAIGRWIAPIFKQARIGLRLAARMIPKDYREVRESRMEIELRNGTILQYASADHPSSLEGEAVSFFVFDEAAKASRDAWEAHLSTISATDATGWVISTPKGRNWFWELAQFGVTERHPDFSFFSFPTFCNPKIKIEVVERARATLPKRAFEQIFLAVFHDSVGGVFEDVDLCATGIERGPQPGRHYVQGIDVAKHHDWSVNTVMEIETRDVVRLERYQGIPYPAQIERMATLARAYGATIHVDSTGVGDPIFDALVSAGLPCVAMRFNSQNKQNLIESLGHDIARQAIRFPPIVQLLAELKAYERSLTKFGTVRYGGPENFFDDCVVSLALAAWAARGWVPAFEVEIDEDDASRGRLYGSHGSRFLR